MQYGVELTSLKVANKTFGHNRSVFSRKKKKMLNAECFVGDKRKICIGRAWKVQYTSRDKEKPTTYKIKYSNPVAIKGRIKY